MLHRRQRRKLKAVFHIVLHEPEIPANTGNIGRTCVASGTALHLIEPLGFRLTEKNIRRAGMDYWPRLDISRYRDYEHFLECHPEASVWYATTKAQKTYAEVTYQDGDFIMFGKESAGIPEEILVRHPERCIRIPMLRNERSLNLSNSAAVILYEALRQTGFSGLETSGELHHLRWSEKRK